MSLTIGTGPFGQHTAGRFNFDPPAHVVYAEPFPRRVRAVVDGATVIQSDAVMLVHESGALPYYVFPSADVRVDSVPDQHVAGYVSVPWHSVDTWFEENEIVEVHPRDPYHRIDTFATSRRVTVSVDGELLADSTATNALFETSLPIRYYFPRDDVRTQLLELSRTVTACAYKGTAQHWSARLGDGLVPDVAWSYDDDVRREAERVEGRIAFYNERVDLALDGVPQRRPQTKWSPAAQ